MKVCKAQIFISVAGVIANMKISNLDFNRKM